MGYTVLLDPQVTKGPEDLDRAVPSRTPGISSSKRASTFALLAAMLSPYAVGAQTEIVVSGQVACPECQITLTPITTLGKLEDEVSLSTVSQFAVDPRGHIYAALTYLPGSIAMYDWEGNLLSTFGRVGGGPGEFGVSPLNFQFLIDDRGNLHVIDSGRRTILGAQLSGVIRTHPLRLSGNVAVLTDGRLVAATSAVTRASTGAPRFTLADSLGNPIRAIGTVDDQVHVAPARDGGFWAPHVYDYRIDAYGSDGSLRRSVRREADWFPPSSVEANAPPFSRPTFGSVYEDPEGRLWTAVRVPAADRARAEALLAGGELRLDRLDWNAVQDTRIEVIDPASGALLAGAVFDEVLLLLDNGYLVARMESPEGLIQAVVSSLSLVTHQTQKEEER